jgi:hypothetical protein
VARLEYPALRLDAQRRPDGPAAAREEGV